MCASRGREGETEEGWTGTAHCVVMTTWEGSGQGSGDQVTRWLRNWKAGGGSQVRLGGETRPHRNEQGFWFCGATQLSGHASALRNTPSPGHSQPGPPECTCSLFGKLVVLVEKANSVRPPGGKPPPPGTPGVSRVVRGTLRGLQNLFRGSPDHIGDFRFFVHNFYFA